MMIAREKENEIMENMEIRMTMLKHNMKFWQVANVIGIDPATLSRWMREELTGERLEQVKNAIEKLKTEKKVGASV